MTSPEHDSCIRTHSISPPNIYRRGKNVFSLLAQREIAPRSKNIPRWHWGDTSKQDHELSFRYHNEVLRDPRRGLLSWVEAESLRHLLANYCPLVRQSKSTIAISFSSDGKMLASTHGDHTVKIIDCRTGICLKVLRGHLRTPWAVRFHPKNPEILASGSLDQEVRLWNTLTATCISSVDFYRPIASIAFHAKGEVLAIASGHRLYIWPYEEEGETSVPAIVLKTRHSLRAVNFHPHGGPFLLTAEVNDTKSSDFLMTRATSVQSSNDLSPAIYVANLHSNKEAPELPLIPLPSSNIASLTREDIPLGSSSRITIDENLPVYPLGESITEIPMTSEVRSDSNSVRYRQDQVLNPSDSTRWKVPFLQGWLIGRIQSQSQSQTATHRVQSDLAASMVETADTELPCTVKLRVWSHNIQNPCNPLKDGCRLTIPYVVLCSEMGAHFSPCGRFMAACVACVLPQNGADIGLFPQFHQDVSTSPTQHPISAPQVIFELRIYSLEESTFGAVLVSRTIRAAHCLTSIQFSPTSEHILLAYGRRHSSLLKSIVIDGETASPVYTVLEVLRVSDMRLVSVLPSAEDEVNVASFHPSPGGGLVYGTKEGKVRFFKFEEGARDKTSTRMRTFVENMADVE